MQWAQFSPRSRLVQNALFVTLLNPSAKFNPIFYYETWTFEYCEFHQTLQIVFLGEKAQIVTDQKLCSGFFFEIPWWSKITLVEKTSSFRKWSCLLKWKSFGYADSTSWIPSQGATTDQAHETAGGAEAKHPTQNNDKASDRQCFNRPRSGKKRTSHPSEKIDWSQNRSNNISLRKMMNTREVNEILTSCR